MRTGGLRLLGLRCVALATAACGAPFASGVSDHGDADDDATSPTLEAGFDGPSSTAPRGGEGGLQTNDAASDAGPGDQSTSPPNTSDPDAEAACPGPDTVHGVFVEAGGVPSGSCGDPAHACATIAAALGVVGNSGGTKDIVYIRGGTYTEQVALPAGVTLQGGWLDAGGAWSRPCTGSPAVTIVRAPEGTFTTVVASYSGSSALDSLTLESTDQSAVGPSQSVYGVFATGASTMLSLLDVNIALAAGGAGAAGDDGPDGGPGSAPGSCAPAANGSAGAPGTAGPPGAGSYGASGYAPGAGGAGTSGGSGANGTPPATLPTCADAGAGCAPTMQGPFGNLFCQCDQALSSCGTPGAFGCGGAGGGGGGGGAGGGASIGVFDWGAVVSLVGGAIVTGGGGAGGNGGSGGAGGMGTQGTAGSGPSLLVGLGACLGLASGGALSCATCSGGFASGQAGGPGGPGGAGGPGGEGAGGGGGDSFCYYQGGSGVVDVDPSVTCSPGAGGLGGNQGLAGQGAMGATGLHN